MRGRSFVLPSPFGGLGGWHIGICLSVIPYFEHELNSVRVIEYEVVLVFWGVGEEIGTNYVPLGSRLRSLLAQPPNRQLASRAGERMS